jgi:hypothetical protein
MAENNLVEEKLAEKVQRLTRELQEAEQQMAACQHSFSKPIPAQRVKQNPIFDHYERHGSDPEPIYRYSPQTEHGWERTCEKCGHTEYTAKTKPIIAGREPDFGGK